MGLQRNYILAFGLDWCIERAGAKAIKTHIHSERHTHVHTLEHHIQMEFQTHGYRREQPLN